MKSLHNLYESILEEKFSFAHIATRLTQRKLKEKGITLNKKQLKVVEEHFEKHKDDLLELDISDYKLKKSKLSKTSQRKKNIKLKFTEDDLNKLINEMNQRIEEVTSQIVEDISGRLFVKLKKDPSAAIKLYKQDISRFGKNIRKTWGKSLDMLNAFITIALDAGSEFNDKFREKNPKSDFHKYEVLLRSHARACQIASEVHTLLCAGFADGAHARWRSLHEIATIVLLIASNDDDIAEQYLLHDGIESYKAAKLYQSYHKKLNFKPIPGRTFNKLEKLYQILLKQFGDNYKGDYGWASKVLGRANPKFRDIEEAVGIDYLRPYYRLASQNVHANPKGVLFKLGLLEDRSDIFLAGPSNVGFTDPAQCTALSLSQITISLLLTDPDLDRLVISSLLMKLASEIGLRFFEVETKIIENEKRIQMR
jgi:hypothetical protein